MTRSKSQGPRPPRAKASATQKRPSRTKPRPIIFEDTDELPAGYMLRPFEDEEYPDMPMPTSGTLSSVGDSDDLPVVESGLSVEPEDLGRQFLRDATEQDNFESELEAVAVDPGLLVLGQVVSEATLEASGHDGYELPSSSALVAGQYGESAEEPHSDEVNVASNVVREASLFDQPTDSGGTREPVINTDDSCARVHPTRLRAKTGASRGIRAHSRECPAHARRRRPMRAVGAAPPQRSHARGRARSRTPAVGAQSSI